MSDCEHEWEVVDKINEDKGMIIVEWCYKCGDTKNTSVPHEYESETAIVSSNYYVLSKENGKFIICRDELPFLRKEFDDEASVYEIVFALNNAYQNGVDDARNKIKKKFNEILFN